MASKFLRAQNWWIKFRHPATGTLIRESLETGDEARAELLRQRVDLELALSEPKLQAVAVPEQLRAKIRLTLPPLAEEDRPVAIAAASCRSSTPPAAAAQPLARPLLNEAVANYLRFISSENAAHHVENKISILRRFLGAERVTALGGPALSARGTRKAPRAGASLFKGTFLDEITAVAVQDFIEGSGVSRKTMRHYREFFHHFFEVSLKFDLYRPTNWHRPNPIAALPSYLTRNRQITFLTNPDVDRQLEICGDDHSLRLAVSLMIHAGLRRAEMLWLTLDSIDREFRYLSVCNKRDEANDLESSLKTGERTVTILPPLAAALRDYLPRCKGRWLVPNRQGGRWTPDNFSKKLSAVNRAAGLPWNCLTFRHTYATQRANEGWTLFRIAKEMGNSVAVVEEYYAAFVQPTF